ncbi:hypothetical protein LTR05_008563 [Lithohypha guttulata]|uniref:Protein kinase domain-containing protein n=1 Tax=Lithohypha guttulata TaxID=1690604 RepID=A0AAN7PHH8_9EURO|nr:hypothetical protein LTR05_008563 [Lithohypha guttulata]
MEALYTENPVRRPTKNDGLQRSRGKVHNKHKPLTDDAVQSQKRAVRHTLYPEQLKLSSSYKEDPKASSKGQSEALSQKVYQPPPPPPPEGMVLDVLHSAKNSRIERRLKDGIDVVVKVCRGPTIPKAADMWLQEENVVQLLDSNSARREIVLPYISGQSVDAFVDSGKVCTLNNGHSLAIWQGAAAGLAWIHSNGILYNDLKPGNTMYDPEERRTVLVDFGISTERIEDHFSGGGTPCSYDYQTLLKNPGP